MTTTRTKKTGAEITQEDRRRAAISRMVPMGSRDHRGRLLPLRFRVAEDKVRKAGL